MPHGPISVLLLLACGCSDDPPTALDSLLEAHVAAVGGRAAIEAVQSVEYRLAIEEPTFSVAVIYRAARSETGVGRLRVDVYADGQRVYSEGYDGVRGWQWPGGAEAAQGISEAGEAALRRSIDSPGQLYGLHELAGRGHRLSSAGRERLDGVDYHVVRLTDADGYAADYYLHPDSLMIERKRESRPLHPDLNSAAVRMETRWSDCRPVDGIVGCFEERTTDLDTGAWMQTARIESVVTNPELDADVFDAPAVRNEAS